MKTKKTIDLGEYIVDILYDKNTGFISVEIYDEGEELIEALVITNSKDESTDQIDPSLN